MAGYSNDAKNLMLTELCTNAKFAGLLNGSGVEISGGTYARKSVTWGTPSSGSVSASNQPVFDVPSGVTVASIAFYSASTSGTLYASDEITPETFSNNGTLTLTSITLDLNAT